MDVRNSAGSAGMVRVRAGIAVLGCAAMLLAGCGGTSDGGAVDGSGASTAAPITRGDVIAESTAASPSVPASKPGPPASLTGSPGDSTVSLTWTPPLSDGGSAITGYNVEVFSLMTGFSPAAGCTSAATSTAVTCAVIDLTSGTEYSFRVTAVNAVGSGIAVIVDVKTSGVAPVSGGVATGSGCTVPQFRPSEPTNVTATGANLSVTVSWGLPSCGTVYGYTVQVATSETGTYAAVAGCTAIWPSRWESNRSCQATGLVTGSSYWFRVAANNVFGTGFYSVPVSGTPTAAVGAPTAVVATPANGTATLSWAAPVGSGASAITGYIVQRSTSSAGPYADAAGCTSAATSTSRACTATGLTNGTTYWFRIAARNATETGSYSSPTSVQTSITAPGTPTSVTATSADASAKLAWMAPADVGGSAVTGYSVQVSTSATGTFAAAAGCTGAAASTSLTCTATGLTNGSTYWFKVAATNAAGLGAYSSAVSVQLPLYPIGSTGPGGGVIFYWSATPFTSTGSSCGTSCQYLEAQRTDLGKLAWCSDLRGRKVDGAGGDAIGDGFRNTDVGMRSSTCSGGAGFRARASTSGGMTDWYVPSSDELIALYAKRSIVGGFTTAKGRQYTETDSGNAWYWTSSQRAGSGGFAEEAKAGDFSNGTGVAANKNNSYRVRLIRAF